MSLNTPVQLLYNKLIITDINSIMIKWLIPLLLLIIFEAVADIFAKEWTARSATWLAVTSLFFYLVANSFWLFSLRDGAGLGRGSVIFSVASAAIAIVLGVIFYKEPVSRIQFTGLLLGLVSLVLIFWE